MWMHRTDDNDLFDRANEMGLKLNFTPEEQQRYDDESNDHIKILPYPPVISTHGECYSDKGRIFFEEWDKITQQVEDQYHTLKDSAGLVGDHINDAPVIDKYEYSPKKPNSVFLQRSFNIFFIILWILTKQ
jgi:hypothetical protein